MNQATGKQTLSEEPIYNIGAVSRMTGIGIATLRAWERRYGFPESGRTSGGHRLYSEADVINLRWVKEQVDGGMRASKAIRALKHHTKAGRFPAIESTQPAPGLLRERPLADGQLELAALQARLTQALIAHNTAAADQILGEALLVHNLDDLMLDAIGPTMAEIGQAWMDKRIDVATEHLATNYLRHRLQTWAMSSSPPYPVSPVALACAPGEWHEGSLLILAALLCRRRWPVAYLGQSFPLSDLDSFVKEVRPQAIVLVAMLEESATALADWPKWLPQATETSQPVVGFGGRAFNQYPELRERTPGLFLGATLREGMQKLESILQNPTVTG